MSDFGAGMSKGGRGFRRRGALHTRSLHFGPNMTPMVDVVMVILVFFMASAAFVGPEWFLRALVPIAQPAPKPEGAGEDQPRPAAVVIRHELSLRVEGGATLVSGPGLADATLAAAEASLAELVKDIPREQLADRLELLLRPAPEVPYQDVVRLHEAAQRLGIVRVGLAPKG